MSKPHFIFRGGELCLQQPIKSTGTRLYGFVVDSTHAHLEAMCDRALNAHGDRRYDYKPLGSRFLLTFAALSHGGPEDPPDSLMGFSPEQNASIWVPTAAVRRGLVPVAERLAFYIPYMFVDNHYSLVGGREIYGFPKNLGEFSIPAAGTSPSPLTLRTYGLPRFNPATEAALHPLMAVTRGPWAESNHSIWDDIPAGIRRVAERLIGGGDLALPGLSLLAHVLEYLFEREVPSVFLKQFRDAEDPDRACYQAVVEALARVKGTPRGGLLLGDWRVKVDHLDSHPIDTDLGLPPEGLAADLAFWVDFDFVLERGKTIQSWGAGQ
jgi:hypothetical protein